jgi:glucosamine kinase
MIPCASLLSIFTLSMQTSILVGDIGSTKSTWWFHAMTDREIHLKGYNPIAHSEKQGAALFESLKAELKDTTVSAVWYYGTGVINETIEEQVRQQLSAVFPGSQLHVSSDLVGAALAASGKQAGAIAILGTGSHAAIWDGSAITGQAVSLGYILGDEGSGCDIGKSLIQAYFYQELPPAIHAEMEKLFPQGRAGFFEAFKNSESPNSFLAEYAGVAVRHKDDPWIKNLIASRFKLFVQRHLIPLSPLSPIHVIGSIGFIFADLLREEFSRAGFSAGHFIQNPSRQLFELHTANG